MSRRDNEEARIIREANAELMGAMQSLIPQAEFRLLIRRFLSDMGALENSGMGPAIFTPNALTTAHESGKLAAVQYLVQMLAACDPNIYITLLKDENNGRSRRTSRLANLPDPGRDDADSE